MSPRYWLLNGSYWTDTAGHHATADPHAAVDDAATHVRWVEESRPRPDAAKRLQKSASFHAALETPDPLTLFDELDAA